MTISVFELFSIGIGPSSSHTVGPMRAAYQFVRTLAEQQLLNQTDRLCVELYGSLALTGKGHGTDVAILNGLAGQLPESVAPDSVRSRSATIADTGLLPLHGQHQIRFNVSTDLLFHTDQVLASHSNGMRFSAYQATHLLSHCEYYSIGGGFIVTAQEIALAPTTATVPFPFTTAAELLHHCQTQNCTIAQLMLSNEQTWHSVTEIRQRLLQIYGIMRSCIDKGCATPGFLPGKLHVKRRASELYQKLQHGPTPQPDAQHDMMNWLNVYAMAVNEENAAGGRIVTAPTNGAAGIIPAVLTYYMNYHQHVTDDHIIDFLLTAAAIAILYKKGASLSGAEVGCQGEIGVASSMAAGALAAVLGGNLAQVENAAEIAMEHHLGMTCDPVGGLVQIPCIERNAMGAVKAVNAARLALMEDAKHKKVSLDKVIITMRETGRDMMSRYKETSQGGLAVNVTEC